MNRKIKNKNTAFLGVALIAIGILFNKQFIESTIISDKQLDSPIYVARLYAFQVLAIVSGTYLLIRQPSVRIK